MNKVLLSKQKFFSKSKLTLAIAAQMLVVAPAWAAPTGGEIVGGTGSIEQQGAETTIVQKTDRLAIDWQGFDVGKSERVEFVQPGQNAVALNRILGNKGSEILGRIDANGHVILVNPQGIVFGKSATVNAGGLIASGLQINPDDFMNGDLAFKRIEGMDGTIINSGMINAAAGGNVALLGKQVENRGLISATLGSVILASGKEAVLTFDESGLLGVRVDEAVLQNEIGSLAAVANMGEIRAENGRVLLSAATTRDVFSQAVNWGEQKQAQSVTYNEDGSFFLGAGGDVINSGTINVSGEGAGDVVALGENISVTGEILANAVDGKAGHVELHSNDTTIISGSGTVTSSGENGGDIKLLGKNVGLLDKSVVEAMGAGGGGAVLVGGDREGLNPLVRNADFVYINKDAFVNVSATDNGDGGTAIIFAEDTARVYGGLSSRGGNYEGSGGFIETSGKRGFEVLNTPDIGATNGDGGHWLIDPHNITIGSGGEGSFDDNNVFQPTSDDARIAVATILGALVDGATVTIKTGDTASSSEEGNITIDADTNILFAQSAATATLNLIAYNDIYFEENTGITVNETNNGVLNVNLNANTSGKGGSISFGANSKIDTNGGDFKIAQIPDVTDSNNTPGANDIDNDPAPGAFDINLTNLTVNLGDGDFVAHAENKLTLGQDLNLDGGDLVLGAAVWEFNNHSLTTIAGATPDKGNIKLITGGDLRLPGMDSGSDITLRNRDKSKELDVSDPNNGNHLVRLEGALIFDLGPGSAKLINIRTANEITSNAAVATDIQVISGRDISLEVDNRIRLNNIKMDGNLDLDSESDIIQKEETFVDINGKTTLWVNSLDVALTNAGNQFGGELYIGGSNNGTARNANIVAAGSVVFGEADQTFTGNLSVDAGGDIEQKTNLTVRGVTLLEAQNIILDTAGNSFRSIAITSAESAEIVDSEDLELNDVTVSGAFKLSGITNLTQSGALTLGELDLDVNGNTELSRNDNRIGILSGSAHAGKINVSSPLKVEDFRVGNMRNNEQLELTFVPDGSNPSAGISSIEVGKIELSGNADLTVSNFTEFVLNGDVEGLQSGTKSFIVNGAEGEESSYEIATDAQWSGVSLKINGRGKGTLIGPASESTWSIKTDGIHQLSTGGRQLSFEGMHKLKGGNEIDTLDYSEFSDGADIKLWALPEISSIEDIEVVKGNSNQVLVAPVNTSNTWTIGNGRNTIETVEKTTVEKANGDVVELVEVLIKRDIEFQGFTNLKGGDSVDNFIVQLDGQDSNGQTPNYRLDGGGSADSLVVKSEDGWSGTYGASQSGGPEFTFLFSEQERIKVGYEGIEDISLNSHLDQMEVKGRVGQVDSIQLSANWWQLNNFTKVKYDGGLQELVIDGGMSDSVFLVHNEVSDTGTVTDPNGAVTPPPPPAVIQLPESLTFKGGTLSFVEGIQLETKSLSLIDLQNGIGTKESPLTISVDALELNNNAGDIYIRELNGIRLNGLRGSDLIDLEVMEGDLSQVGAITKDSGSLQLSTPLGNIVLENEANKIGAPINLNAAGWAAVHTEGDLVLGGVSAGNLILRANGGISSGEAVFVAERAELVSGSNIILEHKDNDFGTLIISQVRDDAKVNVNLVDRNQLILGGINISGELKISASPIYFNGLVRAETLSTRTAEKVFVGQPALIKYDVNFGGAQVSGIELVHSEHGQIHGARTFGAADQMIEVETLADIDPAIFTNVKNYFYQDVSVLLPSDQRYEESSEEETLSWMEPFIFIDGEGYAYRGSRVGRY